MAAKSSGALGAGLLLAGGVALVAVASSAAGRRVGRKLSRADTDGQFWAVMFRHVPASSVTKLQAEITAARAAERKLGLPQNVLAAQLGSIVKKYVPFQTLWAFNSEILPLLRSGQATVPTLTSAQQQQVVQIVGAAMANRTAAEQQWAAIQGLVVAGCSRCSHSGV